MAISMSNLTKVCTLLHLSALLQGKGDQGSMGPCSMLSSKLQYVSNMLRLSIATSGYNCGEHNDPKAASSQSLSKWNGQGS